MELGIENRVRDGSLGAIRLDTETGLAPVSSLGVVPVCVMSVSCTSLFVAVVVISSVAHCDWRGRVCCRQSIPDSVAGPQANPLRDGAVLLLRAGKLLLGAE